MTTRNECREAVYQRFVNEWPPRSDYALGDETFDPPAAPWARLTVRTTAGGQATLGAPGQRKFDTLARAFVQLFFPPGFPEDQQDLLRDAAQDLFRGRRFLVPDIRVNNVSVRELGLVEDGRWEASTIEAELEYDETI